MSRRTLAYAATAQMPAPLPVFGLPCLVNAVCAAMEKPAPARTPAGLASHAMGLLTGIGLTLRLLAAPLTYRVHLWQMIQTIPYHEGILANRLHLAVYYSLQGWLVEGSTLSADCRTLSLVARPRSARRGLMVKRLDIQLIQGLTRTHFVVRSTVQRTPLGPVQQRVAGRLEYRRIDD